MQNAETSGYRISEELRRTAGKSKGFQGLGFTRFRVSSDLGCRVQGKEVQGSGIFWGEILSRPKTEALHPEPYGAFGRARAGLGEFEANPKP